MSPRPFLLALLALAACSSDAAPRTLAGLRAPAEINFAGYENPNKPGRDHLNTDYVLPSDATLQYFAKSGFRTIRLPMYWNRMQPKVGGPLAADQVRLLDAFIQQAAAHDMRVIVDLHAFGRRDDRPLGSPELPIEALASFWAPFAEHFNGKLAGYDIMNEPHDMPNPQVWPKAAQQAVDAIRQHDRTTPIYVEGDGWSNARSWHQLNENLNIHDPSGRIIYSAHIYFDKDTSGQYRLPFDQDGATPQTGPERLKPFVDWLRAHHHRGHIGEFGIPHGDPRWLPVLDGFLDAVVDSRDVIGGVAYWAAGEYMDWYPLTLQPAKGGKWENRPQLKVLMRKR